MVGAKDFSNLQRLQELDLRDTNISNVSFPLSQSLTTVLLPATMTRLSLTGQPNLSTLTLQGVNSLTRLTMTDCPLLMGARAQALCDSLRAADNSRTSKTEEVRLSGIAWTEVFLNLMQWLLSVGDRGTCDLTGSIEMYSGAGATTLSYDEVVTLITRYGNIRSTANALYVNYLTTFITADNVFIGGPKFVKQSDIEVIDGVDWWRKLFLTVASGNNVDVIETLDGRIIPDVTWQFVESDASTFAELPDEYSPWMIIHLLQANRSRTVRVTLTTTTGGIITADAKIGFWNRVPEVGDFAWTDGEFSNVDDSSKKMAGIVVMREVLERDESDNITATKLWVLAANEASLPNSNVGHGSINIPNYNGESYIRSWGLYPGANYGFPDAAGASADQLIAHIRTTLSLADTTETPFNVPTLMDKSNNLTISPSTFQDESNDTPVTGATDASAGNTYYYNPVGDGTGYLQRTQTEAVMDFATEYENEALLAYANRILGAVYSYWPAIHNQIAELGMQTGVDVDVNDIPLTLQAAADILMLILEAAMDAGIPLSSVSRYRELMYIAVRLCSLWSPAQVAANALTEEDLNEQYRRGKWMLPSNGLLARVFNFLFNSSCDTNASTGAKTRTNGAAPRIANSNEAQGVTIAHEAQLPIFANMLYRSESRRNIGLSSSSNHWSCTENFRNGAMNVYFSNGGTGGNIKCYSYVVRPVTAFTFRT